MPLETATYTSDLVVTNPAHTDGLNAADAHLRVIKSALKNTFPNITGPVSATQGVLNYLTTQGLVGPNGSSGAPSMSFASEPSLGFYRSGAGSVALSGNFGATAFSGTSLSLSGNATVGSFNSGSATVSGAVSAGSLSVSGAFSCGSVSGALQLTSAGASLEIGGAGVSNTPYIDFHSGAVGTDYDVRLLVSGGNGTNGNGGLSVSAVSVGFSNNITVGGNSTVSGNQTVSGNSAITGNETVTGTFTAGTYVGVLPAGAVMDFAMATAPAGWVECDGAALSRTTYAQLFTNIGTLHGAGDGFTTFNVPDYRSRFRRHRQVGSLAGAVGTLQSPVNLTHTHTVTGNTGGASNGHTHDVSSGVVSTVNTDHAHGVNINSGGMSANASHTHTLTNSNSVFLTSINNGTGASQGNVMVTGGGSALTITTSATNIDHAHNVAGNTGAMSANASHNHTLSGNTGAASADHSHFLSFPSAASGDANEARPYSATVLTCIKLFN